MLAQEVTFQLETSGSLPGWFWPVYGLVVILMIASLWKIFDKAGKPGWAAIIPIDNIIVLLEVVGRPVWWIFLMFIPFVNLVVGIIVLVDLAKSFGKTGAYALGLIFLSIIFYPMLAFGSATYQGPAGAVGSVPPPPPGGMTA